MYYDRWTFNFHPAAQTAVLSIDFKSISKFLFVVFTLILSILCDGLTEKEFSNANQQYSLSQNIKRFHRM